MFSENRTFVGGNITRPIELRHTPKGTPVTDVSIAINERHRNSEGELKETTTFVDITLWGEMAKYASENANVSDTVYAAGKLRLDAWEGDDGQKRSKHKVVADKFHIIKGANS